MRRRILFVILLFIVLVVGVVLSLTVFFNINKIEVKGESIYSSEDIISASGVNIGDNMFLINRGNVRRDICEKLPFIGSVELKNSLPDKLIITAKETSIKCAVESGGEYILINGDGKVLAKVTSLDEVYNEKKAAAKDKTIARKYVLNDKKIIIIKGVKVESAVIGKPLDVKNAKTLELYSDIMTSFEKNHISGITAMDLSDTLSVVLMYQDRIKIEVGSITNLEKKMALAANVIKAQDEISPYQEGTINLTIDKQAYFSPAAEDATKAPADDDNNKPDSGGTSEGTSEKTSEGNVSGESTKPEDQDAEKTSEKITKPDNQGTEKTSEKKSSDD